MRAIRRLLCNNIARMGVQNTKQYWKERIREYLRLGKFARLNSTNQNDLK